MGHMSVLIWNQAAALELLYRWDLGAKCVIQKGVKHVAMDSSKHD